MEEYQQFDRNLAGIGVGECKNCSLLYEELPDLCGMTKKLSVKRYKKPLDGFSAMTFSLSLGENGAELNDRLKLLKWDEMFSLKLGDLSPGTDYTHRFDFIEGQLYLSLNFTQDGGLYDLEITPKEHSILSTPNEFNPEISDPDLVLAAESTSISFNRIKQEDSDTIKKYSG